MARSDEYLKRLSETLGLPLAFEEGVCAIALDDSLILSIANDIDRASWMISAVLADEGEAGSLDPHVCLHLNFLLHARDLGAIALAAHYGPMFLVHRLPISQMSYEAVASRLEDFIEAWRLVKLRLFFPEQADAVEAAAPESYEPTNPPIRYA